MAKGYEGANVTAKKVRELSVYYSVLPKLFVNQRFFNTHCMIVCFLSTLSIKEGF